MLTELSERHSLLLKLQQAAAGATISILFHNNDVRLRHRNKVGQRFALPQQ